LPRDSNLSVSQTFCLAHHYIGDWHSGRDRRRILGRLLQTSIDK
jgi:hypothetical protein